MLPIDGSVTVEFDIANELKLSDEYERTVIVDVTIEEALTGRRQNNSAQVHLHKYEYKMELIKTADYYKPGLMYVAYVSTKHLCISFSCSVSIKQRKFWKICGIVGLISVKQNKMAT